MMRDFSTRTYYAARITYDWKTRLDAVLRPYIESSSINWLLNPMQTRTLLIIAVLLGLAVAGCSLTGPDETERTPPRPLTDAEKQLVQSDNQFGLTLFRAIHDETPEENLFISPLSVSMALGMTLNGAEGETRTAMEETLEHAGLSESEINQAYRDLIDLLTTLDPQVTLALANSIWYRDGIDVRPDFIDTNKEYFDAEVEALDFSDPEASDIINGWVAENTRGNIEKIVDQLSPQDIMYLINALYFKGDWRNPFDEDLTQEATFTGLNGTESTVDMMKREDTTFPVYFGDRLTAVDLPYGDSLYSMTVLLPSEETSVGALAADFDSELWTTVTTNLRPRELSALEMPKFTLEYEKSLNEMLKDMGMEIAFDPGRADFSGIVEGGGIWVDEVKHKTFIEVDEKGTEAAAVTSVGMVTSLPPSIRIDRPFLFVIREQHSGTILFIGQMTDPAA